MTRRLSLWLFTACIALMGCSSDTQTAGGGTGGTGDVVSYGKVTAVVAAPNAKPAGFVSRAVTPCLNGYISCVTVNAITFDTEGAVITSAKPLEEGMIVTVYGSRNADGISGKARSVKYSESLRGSISGITSAGAVHTFGFYGMTVVTDAETKLYSETGELGWLPFDGALVEISGFASPVTGEVRATYVRQISTMGTLMSGLVTLVREELQADGLHPIVTLNGVTDIDFYSAAPVPLVGDSVEVTIDTTSNPPSLIASEVVIHTAGIDGSDDDEAEIKGFVQTGTSASFRMLGQTIYTNANTRFVGGTALDVGPGVLLEVEGYFSGGALFATEVKFGDEIEMYSKVRNVYSDGSFDMVGLPNLLLHTDPVLTDGVAPVPGAALKVRARNRGTINEPDLLAIYVRSNSEPYEFEIQGPITYINPNTDFHILGVPIDLKAVTVWGGLTPAQFFSRLRIGLSVEAEGRLESNGTVVITEVEIED